MSDPSSRGPAAAFAPLGAWVPGFDFLQSLSQPKPGAAVPPLAGWVAPTLSVEELDKRIQELKAVLFWLEQNATALKATVQAMEVQKMTLSALRGMNVSLQEMAQAFSAPAPTGATTTATASASPERAPAARPDFAGLEVPPPSPQRKAARSRKGDGEAGAGPTAAPPPAAPGLVDPMQWWGALTQQFQGIAQAALQEAQARAAEPVVAPATRAGSAAAPAAPAAKATKASPRTRAASGQQAAKRTTAKTPRRTR